VGEDTARPAQPVDPGCDVTRQHYNVGTSRWRLPVLELEMQIGMNADPCHRLGMGRGKCLRATWWWIGSHAGPFGGAVKRKLIWWAVQGLNL
jgi:hypothetical protein